MVISVIFQKRQVISKCTLVPAERLHKAAKSITAMQQRYTPLPGIDFGPRPAQLPVHFGPITNSPAAKIINSNVVIWRVISQPALDVTQERCPAKSQDPKKQPWKPAQRAAAGLRCTERSESRLCNAVSAHSLPVKTANKDHLTNCSSKLTSDSVRELPR